MNFWFLIIMLGLAFILQFIFTLFQMKSFSKSYCSLRKLGKVAIGNTKGGFKAGAIVMFALNNNGDVIEASYMSGVTVLAKFKCLKGFEKQNIINLDIDSIDKFPRHIQKAILNASRNYKTIMNGGDIEEPKSPIERLTSSVKKYVVAK